MHSELPQMLPPDINVEVLLPYYPAGTCKVSFNGLHKRNTYGDIFDSELMSSGALHLVVGRNSIYNSLPEYMFHPIDRFDNLPKYEEKERFREQIDMQEEEIKNAYLFFAPIDVLLLRLRTDTHSKIEPFAKADIVLQQIIGDTLTPEQQSNRFIRQIIPFLPNCKNIRGNRTLITLMLRKVFMDEGMRLEVSRKTDTFTDPSPRYENQLDMELGACYVGNTYDDSFMSYDIYYWSDDIADEHFLELIDEVEMLRGFLKDYFLSIEEDLVFNISHDDPPLRLSDEVFYNYLNYNTNI
ncbi:MAG: hypothetical protein K6A96_05595 [Prevotella sp.]|nr:hypothetical protein [Prevotella sp.]